MRRLEQEQRRDEQRFQSETRRIEREAEQEQRRADQEFERELRRIERGF